jgi:hypothetical protein
MRMPMRASARAGQWGVQRSFLVAAPPVAFLGDTLERLAIRFDVHELPLT